MLFVVKSAIQHILSILIVNAMFKFFAEPGGRQEFIITRRNDGYGEE
jgi:hypothetical protein